MSNTIAIAGMGWLGQPFAQHLQTHGYKVKGSVTSLEKATSLQKNGFDAYPVEISEDGISGEIQGFLKDVEILVIMIPPGLRRNTGANYVLKISRLLEVIEMSSVKKLIFVGSTSVYSDGQGLVTEKDIPRPDTNAGKQLLQVEQLLFNSEKISTTIVRFGGLFGGSRQPVRYLAGRKNLNGGKAPVNLIHRSDCIGILSEIILQDAFGHIFNGVAPVHPAKETYYREKAIEMNLEPPTYSKEETEIDVFKQVDSENLEQVLNYSFRHSI